MMLLVVAGSVATSVAVPAIAPPTASAQSNAPQLVSDVDGANAPAISPDGRWVVFGGLDGERRTVYRTDRNSGDTAELSPVPDGVPAGDTIHAQLSADGCVVVAVTEIAFDLFRDDDRGDRWDVYRLVVPECGGQPNAWELVSLTRSGVAIDGVFTDSPPALSGSGAIVAYVRQLDDAPEEVGTITVVDITVPLDDPSREDTVAGMPVESPDRAFTYRGARQPVLSENGRHLAFVSDTTASAPLPGWAPGPVRGERAASQVFVWDRQIADRRRSVRLISGRDGVPSELGGHSPTMSEDGRIVAFVSPDRTLVPADLPPCRASCPTQIYRFDRDTDRNGVYDEPARVDPLTIVSAVDAGDVTIGVPVAGNDSSWSPALNADGSQVAFVTDATNLLPSRRGGGGGPDDGDLLVAEVELGAIRRVLDAPALTGVPGAHGNPALSKTGQVVVFDTIASGAPGVPGVPGGSGSSDAMGRAIAAVEVRPRLSLAELDFGSVQVNLHSTELFATVQNAGPAAFEPADIEVTSNFEVTGGTCARGILVAAGAACSVYLTFTPTAQQGYEGTLTVSGAGPDAAKVSATVRGAAGDPQLEADPAGVDLAPGIVGGTGGRVAIGIEQIAFTPTRIVRIELAGAHPDDFVVLEESCTGRYVNPDASCAVEVEFRPTEPGYRSALLIVATETGTGAYTSAVLGGYASYDPTFDTTVDTVMAGETIGAGFEGFPADTPVSIGFDDGSRPFATVRTNADGGTLTELEIPARVRPGEHRLVATAGASATATIAIDVTARTRRAQVPLPGLGLGR